VLVSQAAAAVAAQLNSWFLEFDGFIIYLQWLLLILIAGEKQGLVKFGPTRCEQLTARLSADWNEGTG
jgi:hypothetical protein